MSPHTPVAEFIQTNLVKAQALTSEYQEKLERIERTIREEMAEDSAMAPVYALLRRQLQLPEDHAMELYSTLASQRAEVEKEDDPMLAMKKERKDDKTTECDVASPSPPAATPSAPGFPLRLHSSPPPSDTPLHAVHEQMQQQAAIM